MSRPQDRSRMIQDLADMMDKCTVDLSLLEIQYRQRHFRWHRRGKLIVVIKDDFPVLDQYKICLS